jgi:hypothetical protein
MSGLVDFSSTDRSKAHHTLLKWNPALCAKSAVDVTLQEILLIEKYKEL